MPEVRLLVPVTDNNGQEHPAGEVIDVDEDTANEWHLAGKVSLVADEQALMDAPGHYTDVTGREDVAPLTPGASVPGPQADEDEDDKPKGKKGKK